MDLFLLLKAFLVEDHLCHRSGAHRLLPNLLPLEFWFPMLFSGSFLGGIGLYQPLIDFAGAGGHDTL